jgi:SAM-dependent methyltransferase
MTTPVQGGTSEVREAVRRWWADFPMTYGDEHGNTLYGESGKPDHVAFGSREFFERADATFYRWNEPLHGPLGPFSNLFDYASYRGRDVLEVGCGMGCMAMNWARHGARVTAVDLNHVAVDQTRRRFEIFGLDATIREADAGQLPFPDSSFDYVYSWGVLHHSPGLASAIGEIRRVLKPGGRVGVMLYNRESLLYRFVIRWQEGFVNLERLWLDDLGLASRYTDGDRREGNPHTWPVTAAEIKRELFVQFDDVNVRVLGTDVPNVLNAWGNELGTRRMSKAAVNALARRWGWSLWTTAVKRA